jgi:hypothetical protein
MGGYIIEKGLFRLPEIFKWEVYEMLKQTSYLVRIALMCTLFLFATSEHSQAIPLDQISCQENEVTIFPFLPPTVIQDTQVKITLTADTPVIVNNDRCILTFSTEVASSAATTQLMILQYEQEIVASFFPGTISRTVFEPGPVLTQINGGIDETHTFKSMMSLLVPEGNATITITARPAIQSALGGTFRLRRRCLILECDTQ